MTHRKAALVLAGNGHLDGAEITEAVSLMIALSSEGYETKCFAPNRNQAEVIDHAHASPSNSTRNIMVEAARIARGNIEPIENLNIQQYDCLVFTGGFGVVKNFTDFLSKGVDANLSEDISRPLLNALGLKPIIAVCAAPLLLAIAAHKTKMSDMEITFGQSANATDFLKASDQWAVTHVNTNVDECHIDAKNKLITSGAYMFSDAKPNEVFLGINACIKAIKSL